MLRGKRAGPVVVVVAAAAVAASVDVAAGRTAPVVEARPRCPCVPDFVRHHAVGGEDQLLQGAQVQRRETIQIGVQR